MPIQIYINFNGQCREAVQFYADVFSSDEPQMMTFGEGHQDPAYPIPEEAKPLIMHTRLDIEGSTVMFSDTFPGMPFVAGNNISLAIVNSDLDRQRSYFNKLKEGGKVAMELQETFWSKSYGSLVDRYGIEWQFSHEDKQEGS